MCCHYSNDSDECVYNSRSRDIRRVERIYPNWKEDYEQWNNKGLVDEYDIDERALVVSIIEHESRFQGDVGEKYRGLMQIKLFAIKHRLASFNIIDILL